MEYWTPEMIYFMKDAASKTSYFSTLAQRVKSLCPESRCVCDAGCGTGNLALEFSKLFPDVWASDLSAAAIAALEEEIKIRKTENLHPCCCDLLKSTGQFDLMVFSFFGRIDEAVQISRRHGCRDLIIVKRNYSRHRFSLTDIPVKTKYDEKFRKELKSHFGAWYEEDLEVEFGQPFRSAEDALRFFRLYSRDEDKSVINQENVLKLLEKTDDPVFPYYLRKSRKCVLIKAHLGGR